MITMSKINSTTVHIFDDGNLTGAIVVNRNFVGVVNCVKCGPHKVYYNHGACSALLEYLGVPEGYIEQKQWCVAKFNAVVN